MPPGTQKLNNFPCKDKKKLPFYQDEQKRAKNLKYAVSIHSCFLLKPKISKHPLKCPQRKSIHSHSSLQESALHKISNHVIYCKGKSSFLVT